MFIQDSRFKFITCVDVDSYLRIMLSISFWKKTTISSVTSLDICCSFTMSLYFYYSLAIVATQVASSRNMQCAVVIT
jgi:hypothetical protein